MIRVTFELLPGGDDSRARTIGLMEVANIGVNLDGTADYAVVLKKTPPFTGALKAAWKSGRVSYDDRALNAVVRGEDDEMIAGLVNGHHRTQRGVYDLLYRALVACGLHLRAPDKTVSDLARLRDNVAQSLLDMESMFKPGVKLTLLARTPGEPDRDILVTGDDLTKLAAMLGRHQAAGAVS